jgi:hypothetical protein
MYLRIEGSSGDSNEDKKQWYVAQSVASTMAEILQNNKERIGAGDQIDSKEVSEYLEGIMMTKPLKCEER